MITLISGALGTGKTALAVKLLMESEFYPSSAFIFGVRHWKGAGSFYELKSQEHAKLNQALIDDFGRVPQSCYLIDEAKKIWPSRVAGRDAPAFIDQHLSESRSVSQDWILTCQAPTQIDVALRRLVGRHIHLEKTALGIRYSESGAIRDDLKFERDESRKYVFPVESLNYYTSDEGVTTHQKKGLKLPKRLIALGLVILTMGGIATYFWNTSSFFNKTTTSQALSSPGLTPLDAVTRRAVEVMPPTAAPNHFYYKPRNPEYPELARLPRYPVACVSSASRCSCFDQSSQVLDISADRCKKIVDGQNELATLIPAPPPVVSEPRYIPAPVDKKESMPNREASNATAPEGPEQI